MISGFIPFRENEYVVSASRPTSAQIFIMGIVIGGPLLAATCSVFLPQCRQWFLHPDPGVGGPGAVASVPRPIGVPGLGGSARPRPAYGPTPDQSGRPDGPGGPGRPTTGPATAYYDF